MKLTYSRFATSAVLLASALPCFAGLIEFDIDFNDALNQTGPSSSSLAGYFFTSRGEMATTGDFDGGTLVYPGPATPATFAVNPSLSTELIFQTGFLPSLSALTTAFPTGAYTINATNSGNTALNQSDSITNTGTFFTANTPLLTAATFNGLQGLQSSSAFNIAFPAFTPAAGTSEAFTFFTISNASTGAVVFNESFQPSSTTGFVLPANTLSPNTSYSYSLDYSDRVTGTGSTAPTNELFDVSTEGSFTTSAASVPEPGVAVLVGLGLLGIAVLRKR